MKSIKGTMTEQNLLKAFAGESQARNRYTFFASVAKKEGYEQIAGVFMETAEQEKEHAKRFFKYLEGGPLTITAYIPPVSSAPRPRTFWQLPRVSTRSGMYSMPSSVTLPRRRASPRSRTPSVRSPR